MPQGTRTDLAPLAARLMQAWDIVRGRPFGPGDPITPPTPKRSDEQTQGPRQWQFPVAVNTNTTPRGDVPGLTPFEQLRNLASLYDIAAICIATRIEELCGLSWTIQASDRRLQSALQGECLAVEQFWKMPDGLNDWQSWLSMYLYDLFSIDAATLYKNRSAGGLFGLQLEVIDGATIKPLLDDRGRTLSYQQILYGYPQSQYRRDGEPDHQLPIFAPNELVYRPRWTRSFTAYGFPPTEWIILRVNTALRKQSMDLRHFTDGNIPPMLISPPDNTMNPDELARFQEWFNATLQGEDAARNQARFLPWNANIKELSPFSFDTAIDMYMLQICCAAYGVPANEIGFTLDVNKSSADGQENVAYRRGIGPLTAWLKAGFDRIIQHDLGQPLLEFHFDFGEGEDTANQATVDKTYFDAGAVTSDELRRLRYPDLDGPAPGVPTPPAPATGTTQPL